MLKSDFHTHVKGDLDRIPYTPKQLIDKAAKLNFQVLAITAHDRFIYSKELANYAKSKNILLIPGIEKTLYNKHIVILNINKEDIAKINSFSDIRQLKKKKNILVIAPHPYYPLHFCLKNLLTQHIDIFDAIEYSHFHTYLINKYNKKAVKTAKLYNKPLIGTSDCHRMIQFGTTYTLVDSKKDINSIFSAIKSHKVKPISPPLPLTKFLYLVAWAIKALIRYRIFGLRP